MAIFISTLNLDEEFDENEEYYLPGTQVVAAGHAALPHDDHEQEEEGIIQQQQQERKGQSLNHAVSEGSRNKRIAGVDAAFYSSLHNDGKAVTAAYVTSNFAAGLQAKRLTPQPHQLAFNEGGVKVASARRMEHEINELKLQVRTLALSQATQQAIIDHQTRTILQQLKEVESQLAAAKQSILDANSNIKALSDVSKRASAAVRVAKASLAEKDMLLSELEAERSHGEDLLGKIQCNLSATEMNVAEKNLLIAAQDALVKKQDVQLKKLRRDSPVTSKDDGETFQDLQHVRDSSLLAEHGLSGSPTVATAPPTPHHFTDEAPAIVVKPKGILCARCSALLRISSPLASTGPCFMRSPWLVSSTFGVTLSGSGACPNSSKVEGSSVSGNARGAAGGDMGLPGNSKRTICDVSGNAADSISDDDDRMESFSRRSSTESQQQQQQLEHEQDDDITQPAHHAKSEQLTLQLIAGAVEDEACVLTTVAEEVIADAQTDVHAAVTGGVKAIMSTGSSKSTPTAAAAAKAVTLTKELCITINDDVREHSHDVSSSASVNQPLAAENRGGASLIATVASSAGGAAATHDDDCDDDDDDDDDDVIAGGARVVRTADGGGDLNGARTGIRRGLAGEYAQEASLADLKERLHAREEELWQLQQAQQQQQQIVKSSSSPHLPRPKQYLWKKHVQEESMPHHGHHQQPHQQHEHPLDHQQGQKRPSTALQQHRQHNHHREHDVNAYGRSETWMHTAAPPPSTQPSSPPATASPVRADPVRVLPRNEHTIDVCSQLLEANRRMKGDLLIMEAKRHEAQVACLQLKARLSSVKQSRNAERSTFKVEMAALEEKLRGAEDQLAACGAATANTHTIAGDRAVSPSRRRASATSTASVAASRRNSKTTRSTTYANSNHGHTPLARLPA